MRFSRTPRGIGSGELVRYGFVAFLALLLALAAPVAVWAQDGEEAEEAASEAGADEGGDAETVSDTIVVTGSRIPTNPLYQRAPIVEVDEIEIKRSGLTNLGASLQQIPSMGTAINARFNVPGNSGFPQDGNGIGPVRCSSRCATSAPSGLWFWSTASAGSPELRLRASPTRSISTHCLPT